LRPNEFRLLRDLVNGYAGLHFDDDALVHLLNDSIRSIPGVTEVETFLYLKLSKQTYAWGAK